MKAAFQRFKPVEIRADEARNRQDVRAYLTVLARKFDLGVASAEDLENEVARHFGGLRVNFKGLRLPMLKLLATDLPAALPGWIRCASLPLKRTSIIFLFVFPDGLPRMRHASICHKSLLACRYLRM